MLHAESLQVFHFKVFQQFLAGGGFRKHPVVQLERKELAAEIAFEHSPAATFKQHLFRGEVVQQLVYMVKGASAVRNSPVEISRNATPQAPLPK